MSDLLHPFTFEFFRQGFVVAVLAGGLCALVGTFIVVRGMAYLGHGLSHAVFGGFAVSAIVGISVVVGAAVWGVVVALMVGRVSRRRVVSTDAAIGVLTLASFALGLALLQWRSTKTVNPEAALFGDVLGVSTGDLVAVVIVTVVAVLVIAAGYRSFVACSFDADVAAASGIRVGWNDAILLGLLAVAVLAAMNVMGATLVAAGIVIPPATARLITNRFGRMLWLATVLGVVGGAVGMVASYHLDIASGPTIVLVESIGFGIAYGIHIVRARATSRPESGSSGTFGAAIIDGGVRDGSAGQDGEAHEVLRLGSGSGRPRSRGAGR